jgi:2-polyprenyl-6-methoxyphenol hydroxylase-like FAD-dependent oxidoreductase
MSNVRDIGIRYDVLVVGARAAGASTAMLLARQGLRVLAIDRQAYGSDTLSTHALMRGGVMQLDRWGVLESIVRAGTPAIRRTTFHYGDETIGVDITPGNGIDALFAPRRTVLDRALVDAAVAAGVRVLHGASLVDLRCDRRGRIRGASVRDRNGTILVIEADMVIGADGRNSTIARLVGAETYREGSHSTALIYSHFAGPNNDGYRWYYRPGASAGVIPTNDGDTCVFVAMSPERFVAARERGPGVLFDQILAENWPDLALEIRSAAGRPHIRGFPGIKGYFRTSFGPGWALVGDAGYFKDPLTAHGITDALRDAEGLALAVAAGDDQALVHYQAERDALSLELFEATNAVASFGWDLAALQDHHRRLNRAMKAETAVLSARQAGLVIAA